MGVSYAVDNLRSSGDFVGTGNGQFLHARRIHSHPAGAGGNRLVDSRYSRTKARVVVRIAIGAPKAGVKRRT